MGQTSPISSYDSADRVLSFQRGLLASDGQSVSSHLSLPGVDYQRSYNLDALGNWVTGGWSGAGPAIQFSHDCAPDQQDRTTNNLNQVASINGGGTVFALYSSPKRRYTIVSCHAVSTTKWIKSWLPAISDARCRVSTRFSWRVCDERFARPSEI